MKKSILLTALIFISNFVFAQDITVNIEGQYNGYNLHIDSILIENNSNGTKDLINNLPDLHTHQFNLTQGIYLSSSNIITANITKELNLVQNSPGILKLNYTEDYHSKAQISIYNLTGEKIKQSTKNISQGNNLITIRIAKQGIHIVHFKLNTISKSYKVIGSPSTEKDEISVEKRSVNHLKSGTYTLSDDFQFSIGDEITITTYAKGVESQPTTKAIVSSENIICSFTNADTLGFCVDSRDSTVYKWVKIGEQIWMAENLIYEADSGCWTHNDIGKEKIYGKYYNWETAKTSCIEGWHLPTNDDWEQLAEFISKTNGPFSKIDDNWHSVGKYLKTVYGWSGISINTDDYGFSALPGGVASSNGFYLTDYSGHWWTATDSTESNAISRFLDDASANFLHQTLTGKSLGLNVRCIKNKEEANAITQNVNKFITDVMNDIYLWNENVPVIKYKYEQDSKTYFRKLLYSEDNLSMITDTANAYIYNLNNSKKSFGYSLAMISLAGDTRKYAAIEYVYPNSAAEQAGLKRGDIITEIDNKNITSENFQTLLDSSYINISVGMLSNGIVINRLNTTLTSTETRFNPILTTKIIESDSHKIGYIICTQFTANTKSQLDSILNYFHDNQITELIIDLRYISGGHLSAVNHFCSSVAPDQFTNAENIFASLIWNNKYQQYWKDNNMESQLTIQFKNNTPVKLDLNKLHIITGKKSGSTSKLIINGLKPYMEITTIGDTTTAQNYASTFIQPNDYYSDQNYYTSFRNWGIQPIVLKYGDKNGDSYSANGIPPDIFAIDNLFSEFELGNINEPLLKIALENVIENKESTSKSGTTCSMYKIEDLQNRTLNQPKATLIYDTKIRFSQKNIQSNKH